MHKRLFIAIALSFLFSGCAGMSSKHKVENPSLVPFSYFEGTFILVKVQINNLEPQDFILDTGIGVNIISKSLCEKLNCKISGEHTGHRMSGQKVTIPLSSVDLISLGKATVKDSPVGVMDLEAMMPGSKIRGFLSLGFFKNFPHTIDYQHNVISFEDSSSLEKIRAEGVRVSVRPDAQGPAYGVFIPLYLPNGRKISVEVDTGSQALILNQKFMKELGVKPDGAGVKRKDGKDETGHSYSRFFTKIQETVSASQNTFVKSENPDVMFQKIIYDGLVGHNFLSQFKVTYDLQNLEMVFRPYSNESGR